MLDVINTQVTAALINMSYFMGGPTFDSEAATMTGEVQCIKYGYFQ
jgi:hypothetical protein